MTTHKLSFFKNTINHKKKENIIKEKCRVKTDIYGDPLD